MSAKAICWGLAIITLVGGPIAFGQMFQGSSCNCSAPQPIMSGCAPVAQSCVVIQPQPVYQSVPVTEYRPVKETVKKPVLEVKYVEQPVTEYVPVTETKTVSVPTVSYQNVTENQTTYRQTGYWATQTTPNCRMSACQYDNRPGLIGWMNRTGYNARTAFTPPYTTQRQFVPQTVACTVPVTRRVAVNGTRQVSYNQTTMAAKQSTRRVAVNSVRYEDAEVTVMKPFTVMRNVPIGTTTAFGMLPYGVAPTRMGLQPSPDPTMNATRPGEPKRTTQRDDLRTSDPETFPKKSSSLEPIRTRKPAGDAPQGDEESSDAAGTFYARTERPESRSTAESAPKLNQWVARTPEKNQNATNSGSSSIAKNP